MASTSLFIAMISLSASNCSWYNFGDYGFDALLRDLCIFDEVMVTQLYNRFHVVSELIARPLLLPLLLSCFSSFFFYTLLTYFFSFSSSPVVSEVVARPLLLLPLTLSFFSVLFFYFLLGYLFPFFSSWPVHGLPGTTCNLFLHISRNDDYL